VRPRVAPDVDAKDVDAVVRQRGRWLEADLRVARVDLGGVVHPAREVNDAPHPHGRLPRLARRPGGPLPASQAVGGEA
jgi:hypothetical protein